jgi:hypothetical protein
VVWFVAVIVETLVCGWVQLERRSIRRRLAQGESPAPPPLHRAYGRVLGHIGFAAKRQRRAQPRLDQPEARRRTGLVTFAFMTAAMSPMLLFVLMDGFRMNPVLGQLVAWTTLWLSPMLTLAPARLGALLVAVWRGWLRLDDEGDDGGQATSAPAPIGGPGSHHYWLPR